MSETKKVRCGVVGAGRGVVFIMGAMMNPNSECVVVCDKNPETLRQCRENLDKRYHKPKDLIDKIQWITDFDEMLKMDLDAVMIATEADIHIPFAERCMDAGMHVMTEIPAVASLEEAKRLKAMCAAHPNLKYMAAENCCCFAFIDSWKKMHDDGQFGEVVYAEAEYLHPTDPDKLAPPADPKHWRTRLHAIRYITHELGPLLYVMNDRCVSVSCMEPDPIYNPYLPNKKTTGVAIFKTEKGAVIRILICFGAYTSFDHNYRIMGTCGCVETQRDKVVDKAGTFANLKSIPGTFTQKITIPVSTNYLNEGGAPFNGYDDRIVDEFIKCIVEDTVPLVDVDLAINMALPGILAEESALKGGELIEIPKI